MHWWWGLEWREFLKRGVFIHRDHCTCTCLLWAQLISCIYSVDPLSTSKWPLQLRSCQNPGVFQSLSYKLHTIRTFFPLPFLIVITEKGKQRQKYCTCTFNTGPHIFLLKNGNGTDAIAYGIPGRCKPVHAITVAKCQLICKFLPTELQKMFTCVLRTPHMHFVACSLQWHDYNFINSRGRNCYWQHSEDALISLSTVEKSHTPVTISMQRDTVCAYSPNIYFTNMFSHAICYYSVPCLSGHS